MNNTELHLIRDLNQACEQGDAEKVRLLLEHMHNKLELLNIVDEYNGNALHTAAVLGHVDICEMLIKAGIDVNISNRTYYDKDDEDDYCDDTPLHRACHEGRTEVIKLLLKNGANTHLYHENGETFRDGSLGLYPIAVIIQIELCLQSK